MLIQSALQYMVISTLSFAQNVTSHELATLARESNKVVFNKKNKTYDSVFYMSPALIRIMTTPPEGVNPPKDQLDRVRNILKELDRYIIFLVVSKTYKSQDPWKTTNDFLYSQESDIHSRFKLIYPQQSSPILPSSLSEGAKMVVGIVKSTMESDTKEKTTLVVYKPGSLSDCDPKYVSAYLSPTSNAPGIQFSWRMPFDALSESQYCPKCKDRMSASWTFCPWCGVQISHP